MITPATQRLTAAQALVKYLQVQYSERDGETQRLVQGIFGIFGHGNVAGLGQALEEYGDDLRLYQGRNEQAMVHAAVGFAKARRRRSVLACTSSIGPGATNMVTGAAVATVNRLPVLLLPGDVYATRRQGVVLQQLEHPLGGDVSVNDCFRPVSRFFDRIMRPEQLIVALPEAMRVLTSPVEAGAVTLSLPQDVQAEAYDFPSSLFAPRTWRLERPIPDPRRLAEAIELLAAAERPVIVAGGGVLYSEAEAALRAFADATGIPVVETFGGKGAMTEDSWHVLGGLGLEGNPAANAIAAESDLVLAVGTRLTDFATGSQSIFRHPDVRFVAINVDGRDAHKQRALPVVGDARLALEALTERAVAGDVCSVAGYREEVARLKGEWLATRAVALRDAPGEAMTQGQVLGVLNEHVQPGDTVVAAAGAPPGDLLKAWDATGGRACHLEFGFSTMGYEIPAGLGVRMAGDGEVFVLIGDGTYLMNPTEIVTGVMERLKTTVVVLDNEGFQCIRRLQMAKAGRSFATERRRRGEQRLDGDYLALDLARTAEGFGARVFSADDPEALRGALDAARAEDGPCVIVCAIEHHHDLPPGGVWWDVAPAEVSGDPVVQELRARYEQERRALQRSHT